MRAIEPYEDIPDKWVMVGKCVRHTTCRQLDGSVIPSKTFEYFLTFKLPWKRKLYSINMDAEIIGHPRYILRFKPGLVISAINSG